VLVYDYTGDAAMSDQDRGLWATNFHGQDAEDGFLVLWADSPLALAGAGEHAGPELEFWSPAGDMKGGCCSLASVRLITKARVDSTTSRR
jgi:hypothetical protein